MSTPSPQFDADAFLSRIIEIFESSFKPLLALDIPPKLRELVETTLHLAKLYQFYANETQKCLSTEAFFSASIMGAATLETALMLKCLGEEEKVTNTRACKDFKKGKTLPFIPRLGHMDLDRLIKIGDQLSWFKKDGVPKMFREVMAAHLGEHSAETLSNFLPHGGAQSADMARDFRDLIHPGRCLRKSERPDHASGILASAYVIVAFSAVVRLLQRNPLSTAIPLLARWEWNDSSISVQSIRCLQVQPSESPTKSLGQYYRETAGRHHRDIFDPTKCISPRLSSN